MLVRFNITHPAQHFLQGFLITMAFTGPPSSHGPVVVSASGMVRASASVCLLGWVRCCLIGQASSARATVGTCDHQKMTMAAGSRSAVNDHGNSNPKPLAPLKVHFVEHPPWVGSQHRHRKTSDHGTLLLKIRTRFLRSMAIAEPPRAALRFGFGRGMM